MCRLQTSVRFLFLHILLVSVSLKLISSNNDTIEAAVTDFSSIMVQAGKNSIKFINRSKRKKRPNKKKSKLGFDNECLSLRREVRSLGRAIHRNPYCKNLRIKFLAESKRYKKLIKKKEKEVHNELYTKLCTIESNNPKEFWQIIDKLKTTKPNLADDISPEEWIKHFQTLYTVQPDLSLKPDLQNLEDCTSVEENLNKAISINEIKKVIKI